MVQPVPTLTIIGMIVTILIAVGLPIAAMIIFHRKYHGTFSCVIVGIVTFILFALLLEPLVNNFVAGALGEELVSNTWIYALYGGFAAGLFEETGRFLAMKVAMKKTLTKKNSIMYGIGHGGAEAIILIGLTYVSNIALAMSINSGTIETMLGTLDEALKAQALEQMAPLWTTPSYLFFLAGIERAAAFILQICLSYIVYRAIKEGKVTYWLAAFFIHFFVDFISVLLSSFINAIVAECVLVVIVAVLSIFLYKQYHKEQTAIDPALGMQ